MASYEEDLVTTILVLGERKKHEELQEVVHNARIQDLVQSVYTKLCKPDAVEYWNYLLAGFSNTSESKDKRFKCVKAFLKQINSIEISYKITNDLISRLLLDISTFSNDELIEIVEYCTDSIKIGDPKCVGWKDLLPETINILSENPEVICNGIRMPGCEYRMNTVKSLCTMKWPLTVLTPLANMFRDMMLICDEYNAILLKFSYCIQKLEPVELPALAFQLFSLATSPAQIMISIIGFQKYFHNHYYKKLFADIDSDVTDYNSIDNYSEKELKEAEETVLHHLSYCSQFKISEQQLIITLKDLISSPEIILTPFMLSAILCMTRMNRDPSIRLSSSPILPYLRNVIKNNEDEKILSKISFWCRDTLQISQINIDQLFTVLIDQNKDGKDIVTLGLINLGFSLLRAKNSIQLNQIGITFLQKFIKKRFIFAQGIVQCITEWMIVEQDATQYSECLTILSLTDTYTMSECIKSIKYALDLFLSITGHNAMRMMSFILPVVKISHTIRDAFIDVLKKAMNSKNSSTCQMGIYGFCMLLKQINNSNSQRSVMGSGGILTQQSISGFSLMSQSTIGNQNNPQRLFDLLTLEIIGVLRNCFTQSLDIKLTLYENLFRAIELNPKLTPHIIQFIEWHYRSYFTINDSKYDINFNKIIDTSKGEIQINDCIGRLTILISLCIRTCEKYELNYDTTNLIVFIETLMENVRSIDFEKLGIRGIIDHKMNCIALKFLNFIESLMSYAIWSSKYENDKITSILPLFKHYRLIRDDVKAKVNSQLKKGTKKGRGTEVETQTQNITINGTIVKRIIFKPETILNLSTLERFLRLIYDENVTFASSNLTDQLKNNRDFVHYIIEATTQFIENLLNQPDYKEISHSQRLLNGLIKITKIIYEKCIKSLQDIWKNVDVKTAFLCALCFYQCLYTIEKIFKKRFSKFLKEFDNECHQDEENKNIINILQNLFDESITDEFNQEIEGKNIPILILKSLDIIYEYISHDNCLTMESYNWLYKLCQTYDIKQKELGIVHKLLFKQREKTHSGLFYSIIVMHLEKVLGQIDDEVPIELEFELKSINNITAESCLIQVLNIIRKKIEEIEYFIIKAKSAHTKVKISLEDDKDICIQQMKSIEKSICSQLIHIANTLIRLTNVSLQLGPYMDNVVRILMQTYICLTNLTKHFILRNCTIPISFEGTKFEQLLRSTGKPLANKIYSLISYIEANIFEGQKNRKNKDPKADKAKVLKETKLLPKLILRVENFNKFVIMLSKKTKSQLSHYLHIGTVRDFRIKTTELKDVIDKTISHSSQIAIDESMLNENEIISDNEFDDNHDIEKTPSEIEQENITPKTISSDGDLENENNKDTHSQVLKNLEKVNEKTRKRKSKSKDDDNKEVQPKKRGRSAKTNKQK